MNLPNKITVSRILLIPIIIFLYLADFIWLNKVFAAVLFILASVTDGIDGHIARKRNLITNLGKFLDPIADKLLTISVLILLAVDKAISSPYIQIILIVIVGRELIIGGFRQVAAAKNIVLQADFWGKIKTVFQMIAIPCLMILVYLVQNNFDNIFVEVLKYFSYAMLIVSAVLSILSAFNYIYKNKQVLKTISSS